MSESFFKNDPDQQPQGKVPDLEDTAGEEASGGSADSEFSTQEDRMAAIMAYIPILCFVPLLNMKESRTARFHARQGVLLFLVELIAVIFLIDGISNFVFKGILLIAIALSIAGIYFSFQGKSYKLPIIGDLADKTKL